MGVCGSFLAVEHMRQGATTHEAARMVILRMVETYQGMIEPHDELGVITLDTAGNWGSAALRSGFKIAMRQQDQNELREPQFIYRLDRDVHAE